jgi:hypothetical protein
MVVVLLVIALAGLMLRGYVHEPSSHPADAVIIQSP